MILKNFKNKRVGNLHGIIFGHFTDGLYIRVQCHQGQTEFIMRRYYWHTVYISFVFKGYMSFLAKALTKEYNSNEIYFQTLCPYFLATPMNKYSKLLSTPRILCPSSKTYVRHAVSTFGMAHVTTGYFPFEVIVRYNNFYAVTVIFMKGFCFYRQTWFLRLLNGPNLL